MEQVPMRDGFGKALLKLCKEHQNVVVMDADVAKSTRTEWVEAQFPDHYLNMGVSEQDMVGTAAGMALGGMVPYITTYGVFLAGCGWDQIRNAIGYNHLNVKVCGAHAGISVGPDGGTHQALEDVALMRVIPGMTVVVPCDAIETYKATMAVLDLKGPCYLRFGRAPVPVVSDDSTPFQIGKAQLFQNGSDVTILANGIMVSQSLQAAEELRTKHISARVVNVHTVKPLDEDYILKCAKETGHIVVCEEHQMAGGLGSAVCEFLSQHYPVPVRLVGIKDVYGASGRPEELMEAYGLGVKDVVTAVEAVLTVK